MTAPSGSISAAYETLAKSIAASATFQTAVGEVDETGARNHVYLGDLPPPASNAASYTKTELVNARPFALVYTDPQNMLRKDATAFPASRPVSRGMLSFVIDDNVDAGDVNNPSEIAIKFHNLVGAIIDDMWALSGTAGYLALTSTEFMGPVRAEPNDVIAEGDHVSGVVTVTW